MFLLPSNFFSQFIKSQFVRLPYPDTDFSGQTIIVTGANVGLGLEAARHFARLGASLVILACRDIQKGEAARAYIRSTTKTQAVIEVWHVDLSSFESVTAFCARARTLLRSDVVIENAGIATGRFQEFEGYESTITVNVISTFFMALSLLETLRETAMKFDTIPHLSIVSSDAHQMFVWKLFLLEFGMTLFRANFREKSATDIFAALSEPASRYQSDRYNTSKLISVLVTRELASAVAISRSSAGKPPIIINSINPAYCVSQLQRNAPLWLKFFIHVGFLVLARTTEIGSRTLLAGAIAGEESHGSYMNDCKVHQPSAFVCSEEGQRTQKEVYRQLMQIFERIQPGITSII